jgi:hypothetical protein
VLNISEHSAESADELFGQGRLFAQELFVGNKLYPPAAYAATQ